jgi:hypothetical protein
MFTVLFPKLTISELPKKFPVFFFVTQRLITASQEPFICNYLDTDESSPRLFILFTWGTF